MCIPETGVKKSRTLLLRLANNRFYGTSMGLPVVLVYCRPASLRVAKEQTVSRKHIGVHNVVS
jgi:hypothetical protein